MTKEHICKAELADIPRMMRIRSDVRENVLSDPDKATQANYARFIREGEIWVWKEDGHILGFSAGDERNGSIWAVFVDPHHEGKGIGQSLLSHACASLRRAGFGQATLGTGPGTRAERFYRQAGWVEIRRSAEGDIIFERQLDHPSPGS
jgi:GNAT superfamily N-acetyltransferase